ncbi:hypothetical protein EG68_12623, partial [Paragonimus skrjabini miyazakii]
AKEYVSFFTRAERARVPATLLDGEALDIAADESVLQDDISEGTFRRLRARFITDPHRIDVRRQFHGRIQHLVEKLAENIAADESVLQDDISEGTFRRLRARFITDPHRMDVRRQFHGRIQHLVEKLAENFAAYVPRVLRMTTRNFGNNVSSNKL